MKRTNETISHETVGSKTREVPLLSLSKTVVGGKTDSLPLISTRTISSRFSLLVLVASIGLVLCVATYHGPFLMWQYPLSDLGDMLTESGIPNVLTRRIFDLTMLTSGSLMVTIHSLFSADIPIMHIKAKRVMTFVCSIGFFMLLMPYDLDPTFHEIGGTLLFSMLWGMSVLFSVELNRAFKVRSVVSQVILQATVLPYAFLFVMQIPSEVVAQKFAVVGLVFAVWLTTRVYDQAETGQ